MWLGKLSLTTLCLLLAGACTIKADASEIQFGCARDGECPEGFDCVSGRCVDPNAPLDASPMIDAAVDAMPDAPLASCDELFSAAPGYQLCMELADVCHFNVNTAGGTCQDACIALGSECLNAFQNEDIDLCAPLNEDGCLTTQNSEICVCSRDVGGS